MKKKDKGAGENTGLPLKPDQQAQELRSQSERVTRQQDALSPVDLENLTLEERQKLLYELRVHQVQLAMQNEELRAAQAELEKSRACYFELYDLAPVGYLTVNEQGYITLANLTAATLLGVKRSALISAPITGYIVKEDQDIYYRHRKILFENGEVQQCELRMVKADGIAFWAKLLGNFVPGGDGVPFCRLTLTDVTESKKAEEQLRFQAKIIENSPIIAAYHDNDLNMIWVNRAYEKATGLSLEECRDRKCYQVWNLSKPCRGCPVITAIETGENAAFELTPDNQDHWPEAQGYWLSEATPVRDEQGDIIGALEFAINITDRKQAEKEIRTLNEELEQRVKERTSQLEAANLELDAFSYSASHDLRGPLNRISGFSEALLEDYSDQFDSQGIDYLQRINNSCERMKLLIDDLLALSRVSQQEINREPVELSALVSVYLKELQAREPHQQIETVITPGIIAEADTALIRIVLENLLENAWKFTASREKTHIEFGSIIYEDKETYYMRDNGVGFDMKYSEKIFTAFQRLHDAQKYPGTGIGLNIVSRIIKRHGGEIWAEGEPDKGACFYFTLPGI